MDKKKIIILSVSVFILLIGVIGIILINMTPKIKLKEGNIVLALNEEYKEPGYSATRGYHDITKDITVKNNIDIHKVGTYKVTYQARYLGKIYQTIREVTMADQTAPTITLNGANPVTLCPGKEYQEEGFESLDNYDGNITEKVKIEKENNFIRYIVADEAGNKVETIRNIEYIDHDAPTITLNGGNATSLYVGDTYKELGYSASDDCDGDLTNSVKINGTVDTSKVGKYELSYEVTDQSGKNTKIIRTVVVVARPVQTPSQNGNGKVIYLTFDDGPSGNITPALLDILKEENVKATFFILNRDSGLDYLITREHNEGHTVALHGNTHNYKQIYSSMNAFFDDLAVIQNKVQALTGENATIIRFPGGSSNTVSRFNPGIMTSLTKEVKNRGYHYFDWNVDSDDAGRARSADEVYNNVVSNLRNRNNVVLMHDFNGNTKTLNAIRRIIQYGKNNGYTFDKITMSTPEVHHGVAN